MIEYENLVFEGGGPRGIVAHAGALLELSKRMDIKKIKRVAGTSAGAVVAFLLAIGYSPSAIVEIVKNIDFDLFKRRKKGLIRHAIESIPRLGWFDRVEIERVLRDLMFQKTGLHQMGFVQLSNIPDAKKLFVVCTDPLNASVITFSDIHSADMVDIVCASASVPLLFRPVRWSNTLLTDGGIVLSYPIRAFDQGGVNEKTLGFRVDSTNEISEINEYRSLAELEPGEDIMYVNVKIFQFKKLIRLAVRYVGGIISLMHRKANRTHLDERDWNRTVFVNDKGYAASDFSLSLEDKELLIKSGAIGVGQYFEWLNTKTDKDEN